jgi:hypothetical protein
MASVLRRLDNIQGLVQSWVIVNPGLTFNLLFWFGYISTPVYFRQNFGK